MKNASVHQVMGRGRGHGRTKKKARLVEKVVHVKPKKDLAKLGKKEEKKGLKRGGTSSKKFYLVIGL